LVHHKRENNPVTLTSAGISYDFYNPRYPLTISTKSGRLARRFQRMVEITGPNNNQFECSKAQKLEFGIHVCRLILFYKSIQDEAIGAV